MAASEIEQWWIDKFQENLGPIRKVAGWTTQQLADVSRFTYGVQRRDRTS